MRLKICNQLIYMAIHKTAVCGGTIGKRPAGAVRAAAAIAAWRDAERGVPDARVTGVRPAPADCDITPAIAPIACYFSCSP